MAGIEEPDSGKGQENFRMPPEFRRHVRPIILRRGLRNKHRFYRAVLLMAIEQGEKALIERMGEVAKAEQTGRTEELILAAILAGQLEDADAIATDLEATRPPTVPPRGVPPVPPPGKPKRPGGGRADRG